MSETNENAVMKLLFPNSSMLKIHVVCGLVMKFPFCAFRRQSIPM